MVKRIIYTSLLCIGAAGLFFAYFFFVGRYAGDRRSHMKCSSVDIVITDSLFSSAVNPKEIYDSVCPLALGRLVDSIDVLEMERGVRSNGEVMSAEAFVTGYGKVEMRITQRRPVVRFKNATESYYCDRSGYLFPVKHHIEMPIVTGDIPLELGGEFKGYPDREQREWLKDMASLAEFIESDGFLKENIQQIDIESSGDIVLYTYAGNQKIVFGKCEDIAEKFRKLEAFYKNIVPEKGADRYSCINLKYKNQIICR